jgi:ABC-type amino acid transport substrate-binding protein
MTDPGPIEGRISRWLHGEAPDDVPNHVLEAAFARSRVLPQESPATAWLPRRFARRNRAAILLAAALLLVATLLVAAIAGGVVRLGERDLRARVHDAGAIRIAVRAAPPQAVVANAGLAGFDIDVANELGRRLGVRVDIVTIQDAAVPRATGAFDLEAPSLPASVMDPDITVIGPAYYVWPHYLLVSSASSVTRLDQLSGATVCVVDGDSSAAWARGSIAGAGGVTIVTRTTDDACLSDLRSGAVAAAVTSAIGPNDLAVRGFARSIGGPPAEVRAIVARRSDRPETLLDDVRAILRAMATDGTLGNLSKTRFGADLATPVAGGG